MFQSSSGFGREIARSVGYKTSVSKTGVDKLPGTNLPLTFLPTNKVVNGADGAV